MNWFDEIFVKHDVRKHDNHVKIEHFTSYVNVGERDTIRVKNDGSFDAHVGDQLWIQWQMRYNHVVVSEVADDYVLLDKVCDDFPNDVEITDNRTTFKFGKWRLGPKIVIREHDESATCKFAFTIGHPDIYNMVTIRNLRKNDIVDPWDSEFFQDPIMRMRYATFVNDEKALFKLVIRDTLKTELLRFLQ